MRSTFGPMPTFSPAFSQSRPLAVISSPEAEVVEDVALRRHPVGLATGHPDQVVVARELAEALARARGVHQVADVGLVGRHVAAGPGRRDPEDGAESEDDDEDGGCACGDPSHAPESGPGRAEARPFKLGA